MEREYTLQELADIPLSKQEKKMSRPEEYRNESPWQQAERHHQTWATWAHNNDLRLDELANDGMNQQNERRSWHDTDVALNAAWTKSRKVTVGSMLTIFVARMGIDIGIFTVLCFILFN